MKKSQTLQFTRDPSGTYDVITPNGLLIAWLRPEQDGWWLITLHQQCSLRALTLEKGKKLARQIYEGMKPT